MTEGKKKVGCKGEGKRTTFGIGRKLERQEWERGRWIDREKAEKRNVRGRKGRGRGRKMG